MSFFKSNSKTSEGGLINVIRCDEPDYLVWKWRPSGNVGETKRENSIRYGSTLRVKDGEVAVFVYAQGDKYQDYIIGPFDQTIKTANFPVLAKIVGLAFGGDTPFQAEIYFINLASVIQVKFAVPYFDVYDPRFLDFGVPTAVRGTITFNIADYQTFIKLHRLIDFSLTTFSQQIKDAVGKYIKGVIANAPSNYGIPVLQLERKILEINNIIEDPIRTRLQNDFGVNLKAIDIGNIDTDKESQGYAELRKVTAEISSKTTVAQADLNIKNIQDTQRINSENMEASLKIQREELQRAQKLQTEGANFQVHQLNQQTTVSQMAAQSLGQLGQAGNMSGGGSMNPGAMMAGIALGGSVGSGMAGMMNNMISGVANSTPPINNQTPPPIPSVRYSIAINGKTEGPFELHQLQEMALKNEITKSTFVWKPGMENWASIENVQELAHIFSFMPPPPPVM